MKGRSVWVRKEGDGDDESGLQTVTKAIKKASRDEGYATSYAEVDADGKYIANKREGGERERDPE